MSVMTNDITMRTKLAYAYILLIHLCLALVLWKPDFISRVATKFGIPTANMQYFYRNMTCMHKAMDSSIPDGATIFIGDSITQALATSAITQSGVNFGIGSDTTRGVINRLPLYESIERAKVVVLAIGVNDIHQKIDHSETLLNYKYILDRMPSDVHVIASSILPIGSGAQSRNFTNAAITSLNSGIEALAKDNKNVTYINVNSKLKDEAGFLRPEFHVGDGVHLSNEGYEMLIGSLREALLGLD